MLYINHFLIFLFLFDTLFMSLDMTLLSARPDFRMRMSGNRTIFSSGEDVNGWLSLRLRQQQHRPFPSIQLLVFQNAHSGTVLSEKSSIHLITFQTSNGSIAPHEKIISVYLIF